MTVPLLPHEPEPRFARATPDGFVIFSPAAIDLVLSGKVSHAAAVLDVRPSGAGRGDARRRDCRRRERVVSGWPYLYTYHVLACFNGDPTALPEDDVRWVLRRMPPVCLVALVKVEAAETPQKARAA